jgi:hypothetical protein
MDDKVPQAAIDSIAQHINQRNNIQYGIPIVGNPSNTETPQIFEIIPFDQIDNSDSRVYAVDGSKNSHSFYNGISIGLYRAGYICFQGGNQIRMNDSDDPIIMGKAYTPKNILITCEEHLFAIYDELLGLDPTRSFLDFLASEPEQIFPYSKDIICQSISTLLSFCQEVLEWSLIYEISCRNECQPGDIILKDGTLRSLNMKQKYIVKLGEFLSKEKQIVLIGITKNSPIKMELTYTLRQIDSYLQDKLKPGYPFKQTDRRRQKLCCWFEVPDSVLLNAYGGSSSGMYARKALEGGRGVGLFFAARLDYVEKLQNYDWVIADMNIFDAIPNIKQNKMDRDTANLQSLFYDLTRYTQEHYILGYPYPLVEAHNFVTLKADFKEEIINRVKHSLYSTQRMDHIEIENMFLDIHSRF